MTTVTLIDNYDSFTWNLWHYLGQLGCDVTVHRNDAVTVDEVLAGRSRCDRAVARPLHAERGRHLLRSRREGGGEVPIFGVCLGHQAIGQVIGGEVVRAPRADARQALRDPPSRAAASSVASTARSRRRATIR